MLSSLALKGWSDSRSVAVVLVQVAPVMSEILAIMDQLAPVAVALLQIVAQLLLVAAKLPYIAAQLLSIPEERALVLLQLGAVGRYGSPVAGLDVLAEPEAVLGDFALVPRDLPLVLTDLLLVAGDLPAVLTDLTIVTGELALILPDFPDITRNLPTVLADVPVLREVVPLIPVGLLGAHDGCPQRDRHDRASHEPRESMHGAILLCPLGAFGCLLAPYDAGPGVSVYVRQTPNFLGPAPLPCK